LEEKRLAGLSGICDLVEGARSQSGDLLTKMRLDIFVSKRQTQVGGDHHLNHTMLAGRSCEVEFAIWMAEFTEGCRGLKI
jgi:hypothetical protein